LQVLVCPPYPFISSLREEFGKVGASVGAQDISIHESGSKTGEVSGSMLSSIGVSHVIVGHSERRAMGETDEVISTKLTHTLRSGMTPILCIGELHRDNEGLYLADIKSQIMSSFLHMTNSDIASMTIAYEPVWAVGQKDNIALTGHELHQMVIYIRKVLREVYNESISNMVKILYGGSVTPQNAEDIIWNGEVDGLLIGRASFDPKSYEDICKAIVMPTITEGTVRNRQIMTEIKDSLKNKKQEVLAEVTMRNNKEKLKKGLLKKKK
jgi:triosephosphate isomerase